MQSDREQSARLHAGLVFGSHHKGAAGKLSTADLRSRDEQELRWQVQTHHGQRSPTILNAAISVLLGLTETAMLLC